MATITYELSLPYKTIPGMLGAHPAAEVELYHGDSSVRAVGILDSGAMHTGFSGEIAQLLGIDDVYQGNRIVLNTLGGTTDLYMFDLEMQIVGLGVRFGAQVGFFPGHAPRNILGRIVVFSKFQIGFSESKQQIHFSSEGTPTTEQ